LSPAAVTDSAESRRARCLEGNVAGTFKVIAFLPEGFGEPVYRIEHVDTDHRQIARESEVTKRY
jgi:hypothetical protein